MCAFARLEHWVQAQPVPCLERVAAMLNAAGIGASPVPATGEIQAGEKGTFDPVGLSGNHGWTGRP